MKTQVQELADNRVRMTVEVPAHDVEHALDHALADLSRAVRIPGFRKGKAPKPLVMQRVGRDAVVEEALQGHLGGWYSRAVAVTGIDPVDRPTIDWQDEPAAGTAFSFSAEVEVKPAPKVRAYKGLEAVKPDATVPDEAVQEELERLQASVAELRPVERPAEAGDFVVIDFVGSIDGRPFEGGSGTDYAVELGEGRLLPDMERAIAGMRAGEERDVPVTFPADYPADGLAGESASFHLTLKDVKERVLPALDDEFARSASEFDTVAELRDDIVRRLTEALEAQVDMVFRGEVLDALAKELVTPVPEPLVRNRMAEMTRSMIDTLRSRGFTMDEYLRRTGQSADAVLDAMRPQAEDAVRKDMALEAVADAEGVEVTDEMIESFVREQAPASGESPDDGVARIMGDPATLTAIRLDLRLQKALDVVVEHAKPISEATGRAREALWTPGKEKESAGSGGTSRIWTPGSREPADR
jgi:trigger factor